MGFWIIAGLMTLMIGASLVVVFLRPGPEDEGSAAHDMQVYRDQLREVERDLERGVLNEDEAERTRTEVARRLLEADRVATAAGAGPSGAAPRAPVFVILGLLIGGTVGLYWAIGAPGYPDFPIETRIALIEENRADRPSQEEVESAIPVEIREDPNSERAELLAQLRTEMARRPDDPEGWRILAFEEARVGNFRAARRAQERLVEILGEEATSENYLDLAEMMFFSANGYISPETEAILQEILRLEPTNGGARYYVGLMYSQQGRPDLGYPVWRNLLADSEPGDPWLEPIRGQIEMVAAAAGDPISVDELPQPPVLRRPAGPTAADIAAAEELPMEDRMAMIEGMVAQLAERLANEGGTAEDWARLISSFLVLGREAEAREIYNEALSAFARSDSSLEIIRAAGAALEDSE